MIQYVAALILTSHSCSPFPPVVTFTPDSLLHDASYSNPSLFDTVTAPTKYTFRNSSSRCCISLILIVTNLTNISKALKQLKQAKLGHGASLGVQRAQLSERFWVIFKILDLDALCTTHVVVGPR